MNDSFFMPFLVLLVGYLFGSFLSAIWVCRAFHVDITTIGSGNPGMTNVWRTLGWKQGLLVAVLDASKGYFAAFLGAHLTHSLTWGLLAGVAAVVGHSFSIFNHFKGGKGVLTGFAVFLFLSPIASLSSLSLCCIVLALTRFMSLGSLAAAVTLPFFIFLETRWHGNAGLNSVFLAAFIICSWVVFRHRSNMARLANGTEPKFQGKAS